MLTKRFASSGEEMVAGELLILLYSVLTSASRTRGYRSQSQPAPDVDFVVDNTAKKNNSSVMSTGYQSGVRGSFRRSKT